MATAKVTLTAGTIISRVPTARKPDQRMRTKLEHDVVATLKYNRKHFTMVYMIPGLGMFNAPG